MWIMMWPYLAVACSFVEFQVQYHVLENGWLIVALGQKLARGSPHLRKWRCRIWATARRRRWNVMVTPMECHCHNDTDGMS